MSKSSACTVAVVECSAHINQDAAVDMRRGRQAYARLRGASVLGKVCWAPVLVVFFLMTPYGKSPPSLCTMLGVTEPAACACVGVFKRVAEIDLTFHSLRG